jgi:hypothetical protein
MITPMVARLVRDPFDHQGWLFEFQTGPLHRFSPSVFRDDAPPCRGPVRRRTWRVLLLLCGRRNGCHSYGEFSERDSFVSEDQNSALNLVCVRVSVTARG